MKDINFFSYIKVFFCDYVITTPQVKKHCSKKIHFTDG